MLTRISKKNQTSAVIIGEGIILTYVSGLLYLLMKQFTFQIRPTRIRKQKIPYRLISHNDVNNRNKSKEHHKSRRI